MAAALSPALIAGLGGDTWSAIVIVAPPLLASAPSCGLTGVPTVPTWSPFVPLAKPVALPSAPMRLCPEEVNAPLTSGFAVFAVFAATIVFTNVTGPVLARWMPPPWPLLGPPVLPEPPVAELPATVQFVSSAPPPPPW